jgi:hypothetical protein
MHGTTSVRVLPFLALALALACGKPAAPPAASPSPYAPAPTLATAPLRVADVELGRAVDAERRVSDKTDSFKPTDTIYVSVVTEGTSPGAKLSAHWTYQDGQVVKHDETSIAPSGRAVTEFHIAKPSGWPVGDYKVEVMIDGASAGSKTFKVGK